MIVTTHQPIFLPWPGFFYKALRADVLVLLDDVQFPLSRGWMTRNRLKSDQGELWLRVPVHKKGRAGQSIREVALYEDAGWRHKHLEGIRQHYRHAPYLSEHLPPLEAIYARRDRLLVDFNMALITHLWAALGIEARLLRQTEIGVTGRGTALLAAVCRAVGAAQYLALPAAEKYVDQNLMRAEGIGLRSTRFRPPIYPQLWGPFRYNLSTLDLLLNCGPKARDIIAAAG